MGGTCRHPEPGAEKTAGRAICRLPPAMIIVRTDSNNIHYHIRRDPRAFREFKRDRGDQWPSELKQALKWQVRLLLDKHTPRRLASPRRPGKFKRTGHRKAQGRMQAPVLAYCQFDT